MLESIINGARVGVADDEALPSQLGVGIFATDHGGGKRRGIIAKPKAAR
jgi:hypothetical protein